MNHAEQVEQNVRSGIPVMGGSEGKDVLHQPDRRLKFARYVCGTCGNTIAASKIEDAVFKAGSYALVRLEQQQFAVVCASDGMHMRRIDENEEA